VTSARNSPTARTSSPISSSRAAYDMHPAAGGSRPSADHHDQDTPAVIKQARPARPRKIDHPKPLHRARDVNAYPYRVPAGTQKGAACHGRERTVRQGSSSAAGCPGR
jgi:hypothetical protein